MTNGEMWHMNDTRQVKFESLKDVKKNSGDRFSNKWYLTGQNTTFSGYLPHFSEKKTNEFVRIDNPRNLRKKVIGYFIGAKLAKNLVF